MVSNNLLTNINMKKLICIILLASITNILFAQTRSRSAKTGRFVTKSYANTHKSTTYTYKVKK